MKKTLRLLFTCAIAISLLGVLTAADDGAVTDPKSFDTPFTP